MDDVGSARASSTSTRLDGRGLLDCSVESYERLNDGSLAEEHVFVIRVWCERTYTYAIRRTAMDFMILNAALRKRFPRAGLPEVPIAGAIKARRSLALGGGVGVALVRDRLVVLRPPQQQKPRGGVPQQRSSMFSSSGYDTDSGGGVVTAPKKAHAKKSTSTLVVTDASDASSMASYRQPLERWLRELMGVSEVVGAEELIWWLGDVGEDVDEVLVTEADFALEDEPVRRAVVRHGASFDIELRVPRGHFLVWSFASRPRDVAFSLECDGREARTYERVPSHERLFQGVWENAVYSPRGASEDGVDVDALVSNSQVSLVTVRWGNEYAKWRDKRVYYQIAVLSPRALDVARRRHREKAELEAERDAHREALERVAKKLATNAIHDDDDAAAAAAAAAGGDFAGTPRLSLADDDSADEARVRAMPRRELEALAVAATKKTATLADALAYVEREAATAASQRDDAVGDKSALTERLAAVEEDKAVLTASLADEKRKRLDSEERDREARAQLIELRDATDRMKLKLEAADRAVAALKRERDLLAQAARGYKDSAELARGDARCVRDQLESTREAIAVQQLAPASAPDKDDFLLADLDDDDLLKRVDALQSRIDSELSHVDEPHTRQPSPPKRRPLLNAHDPTPHHLPAKPPPPAETSTPTTTQSPPPPPPPRKDPLQLKPRRHDLLVLPGYGPGDEMPFNVEGLDLSVVVPAGLRPGDTFTIELRF